jgi:hypothetical protein
MTMVRLNQRQRSALGDTLRGLANLTAAALVLSQFVGQQQLSWRLLIVGVAAWATLMIIGVAFLAGND